MTDRRPLRALVEAANVVEGRDNRQSGRRLLWELEWVDREGHPGWWEIRRELVVSPDGIVDWQYDRDQDSYPRFSGKSMDPESQVADGSLKLVDPSTFEDLWAQRSRDIPQP